MDVDIEVRIRLLYEVLCENNELTELSHKEVPFDEIPSGRKKDLTKMLKSLRALVVPYLASSAA